jgi:diaminohydroxyphosphoribosylaminopyrimidine deaminase/5-amino-6-(5-phosphoribosylamino)uracil reductase
MNRALDLARSVVGWTSPNPAVGAVIVQEGRVIGEGATQPPGGAHAEISALRQSGSDASGATLYVTLEPCATQGRTPACTEAIIGAGISTVVIAAGDPDVKVDGRGIEALRTANIDVQIGDGSVEAFSHYEAYRHHRQSGRPFVTAKFAVSLDGKIASTSGDSRWVSGPATRAWAHRIRPTMDAILVGVNTIILDDPQLTARPDGVIGAVSQPLRIVLDSRGRTPLTAQVLQGQDVASTLIVTTAAAPAAWRHDIETRGARVCEVADDEGRVALSPMLDRLGTDEGIVSLLVEGGGRIHGAFVDQHLVNKVQAIVAPMIIGGEAATAVAGVGARTMADVVRLRDVVVENLGDDVLVTGYPIAPPPRDAVTVRPGGAADLDAFAQVIADPAQRTVRFAHMRAAFDRAKVGDGAVWIAETEERIVGGLTMRFEHTRESDPDSEHLSVDIDQLYIADPWRDHSLGGRLVETAEASAAGRGARWLTATIDASTSATLARSTWSRADWSQHGYRYYRQDADGRTVVTKSLGNA